MQKEKREGEWGGGTDTLESGRKRFSLLKKSLRVEFAESTKSLEEFCTLESCCFTSLLAILLGNHALKVFPIKRNKVIVAKNVTRHL